MKCKLFAAAGVAAMMLAVAPASAVVVFDQSTAETGLFGRNSNGTNSGISNTQQIADDFQLSVSTAIASVSWTGKYHDSTVPAAKTFQIRFFADAPGNPGAQIFEQSLSVTGIDTGVDDIGPDRLISYSASLTGAPVLTMGTTYWLSILENDPSTTSDWAWSQNSTGSFLIGVRSADVGIWSTTSSQRNMAFSLSDTDIPEPGTLALFGLGLAGLGFARRRKAA